MPSGAPAWDVSSVYYFIDLTTRLTVLSRLSWKWRMTFFR